MLIAGLWHRSRLLSTSRLPPLDSLISEMAATASRPKDYWEVAARLEVSGIRDRDAGHYGHADVFSLAATIFSSLKTVPLGQGNGVPAVHRPLLLRFVRDYLKGLLFAMPMAAQVFAMILFGYALWAWVDFSNKTGTAIALGTIMSFLVTGGFAQAIGRRGLFYANQHEPTLMRRVSYRFLRAGFLTMAVTGVVLILANFVLELLPGEMAYLAALYYFLLSSLWLCFAVLYMLQRQLLFTSITVIAILVVHAVMLLSDWGMVMAHSLGLLVAIALSALTGWWILRRMCRDEPPHVTIALPRNSILVYATGPYFTYGVAYFGFFFIDRLLAWTADAGRGLLPYFIWFDARYELGMDWALFSFILSVGVLEFTMREFSERINATEKAYSAGNMPAFDRKFARFYYSHLALFLAAAVVSILVSYWGMIALRDTGLFPFIGVFFNPVTEEVFWWAAAGYAFLVWALFNSVFLFALSRPQLVLRSLLIGFAANLVIGFVLSRAISYELAVLGMTLGALVFLLVSTFHVSRVFRRLDYYYYSAY